MRRDLKYSICIIASMLLISCGNEIIEYNQPRFENDKIGFNLNVGNFNKIESRAVNTFGVVDLHKLQNSADGFAVSTNGLVTNMSHIIVKYNNSTLQWNYPGNYYWPKGSDTQNIAFTAFAPAQYPGASLTGAGLKIDNYIPPTDLNQQVDIIYASPSNFNKATSGTSGVSLTFKHILTQIVFSITTDIPSKRNPVIESLTLSLPYGKGAFDDGKWDVENSNNPTYNICNNISITSSTYTSPPILVVPTNGGTIKKNTILNLKLKLIAPEATIIKTFDLANLDDVKKWEQGQRITYNVKISSTTRMTRSEPQIVFMAAEQDWLVE